MSEDGRKFLDIAAEESEEDRVSGGSEEEEEEDGSQASMDSFVARSDDEDEDPTKEKRKRKKEQREIDEMEMEVRQEAEELLEMNYGAGVANQVLKKRPRLIGAEEDEDEGSTTVHAKDKASAQKALGSQLFGDEDEGSDSQPAAGKKKAADAPSLAAFGDVEMEEEEEEEEEDDWIVDDLGPEEGGPSDGGARKKASRKKRNKAGASQGMSDQEWLHYRIFGDFNVDEEGVEGEEDEVGEDEVGEDEEGMGEDTRLDPAEMERHHLTARDNEIVLIDQPERMQELFGTRQKTDPQDLRTEAEWIFRHVLTKQTLTRMHDPILERVYNQRRDAAAIPCIEAALALMHFEELVDADGTLSDASGPRDVPYIAQYRKERVGFPQVLNMHDLWAIHDADKRYLTFTKRKAKLTRLFGAIAQHIEDAEDPDREDLLEVGVSKTFSIKVSHNDERCLSEAQTDAELDDILTYLNTLFPDEVAAVKAKGRAAAKESASQGFSLDGDEDLSQATGAAVGSQQQQQQHKKRSTRSNDFFDLCRRSGLFAMTKALGISLDDLATNVYSHYAAKEPRRCENFPESLAMEYLYDPFKTDEMVLRGMRYAFARMMCVKPTLRHEFRTTVALHATITTRPTAAGFAEIEDWSPYAGIRYLTRKPLNTLRNDQFLWIQRAATEKKIEYTIDFPEDRMRELRDNLLDMFRCSSEDEVSQEWHKQKTQIVSLAVDTMMAESFRKELVDRLTEEAARHVREHCANFVRAIVSRQPAETDRKRADGRRAANRVVAVVLGTMSSPSYVVAIKESGEVTDWLKLNFLLYVDRKRADANAPVPLDKRRKDDDLASVLAFLQTQRPDLVVIAGETMDARNVHQDITNLINDNKTAVKDEPRYSDEEDEEDEERRPANLGNIRVSFVDTTCASVYASSENAEKEFPEHPLPLRKAIFCARVTQNPQAALALLYSASDEIMCVPMHPLQGMLPKRELRAALYAELITAINRAGVDLADCVRWRHVAHQLQFVAGLGPRKAEAILEEAAKDPVVRREKLAQLRACGPCVAHNCAGFIIIHPGSNEEDEDEADLLDSTRIHPEAYPFARRIALDALDRGAANDMLTANKSKKDEIRRETQEPIRDLRAGGDAEDSLRGLNLDVFLKKLEDTHGSKEQTLADIVDELAKPFQDKRGYIRAPRDWQLFNMLTGEVVEAPEADMELVGVNRNELFFHEHQPLPITIVEKQMVEVTVQRIIFSREGDREVGVAVAYGANLHGFISRYDVSDNHIDHLSERVEPGQVIQCRVLGVKAERFSVDLSCKSSYLRGEPDHGRKFYNNHPDGRDNRYFNPRAWGWDEYYDENAAAKDKAARQGRPKDKAPQIVGRVIDHPNFKNVSYAKAVQILEKKPVGEAVVRPSSKGTDHLTVTWKAGEGVYDNIDVREEDKPQAKSIGNKLFIGKEEFSDIDEILARHIQPRIEMMRLLASQDKFFRAVSKDEATALLRQEKEATPTRIPYYVIPAPKAPPGSYLLVYMPRSSVRVIPVSANANGYKIKNAANEPMTFAHPNALITWFKKNFNTFERQPQRAEPPRGHALQPGVNQAPPRRPRTPPLPGGPPGGYAPAAGGYAPAAGGYVPQAGAYIPGGGAYGGGGFYGGAYPQPVAAAAYPPMGAYPPHAPYQQAPVGYHPDRLARMDGGRGAPPAQPPSRAQQDEWAAYNNADWGSASRSFAGDKRH